MRKVVLLLFVVFTLSLCGDAMASGIKDEDVRQQMVYTLYVIAMSSDLEYVSACEPYIGEILSVGWYFHMNWGQQYSANGWYLDGPYVVGDIVYNNDRIDIVNIRKSN